MLILDRELTLEEFVRVVRLREEVTLSDAARERIVLARGVVERIVEQGTPVYGVNTGFGRFENVSIDRSQLETLQHNLIVSHAIGMGERMPAEAVRGMLLLRAQSLALGHSGVRPVVVETLLALLNANALPVVPAQGSVGASGDLAPLAHLALGTLGLGEMTWRGEVRPAATVLADLRLEPLTLQAKEGLALINGTQQMGALLALALHDARTLLHTANLAAAMTVEGRYGSHRPFGAGVVGLRPHPGALAVAAELREFLRGSEIAPSHVTGDGRVQDPYSLRAVPQVHGATLDTLVWAEAVLAREFASVTDNPLIFPDSGEVVSGGNFHGQPLAVVIDALKVAVAELGSISERRTEQLLNPALSGLPAFLTPQGGLSSGFMIAQYTAAALVSENKVLAHPASVDSIPTSAGQEDHVSMGAHGARQLRDIVENVAGVLAVEVACAAQALDFQRLRPGAGVDRAWQHVRTLMPTLNEDRYFRPEVLRVRAAVISGALLAAARREPGPEAT